MKSLFTFLLLASFSFLNAQDLTIAPANIALAGDGEYIDYGTTVLTNNGTSTIELAVRLESVCYNENDQTGISICIDQACFLPVTETTSWGTTGNALLTLAPGESSDVLKFSPSNEMFGSRWNVVFYERTNEDNFTALTVEIGTVDEADCMITSTNNFAYEIGKAFPNPVTADVINIAYQIDANDAQLDIYNALGMRVESVAVSAQSESVTVDVANYSNGVYFYQITDGKKQSKMLSFVR